MSTKQLKIYFTSDVHGYFYPTSYGDRLEKPMGLFACAAGFKKDGNTLVIDGGDMLQGSAFAYYSRNVLGTPEFIAQMVNDCGFDYYALGNHDFNYGQEYQAVYRKLNKAVCLCQNVCDSEGNTLYPYTVKTMENGLRVGLVGIVTDFINVWEKKENIEGLRITDPFQAAKEALEQLKKESDITVCIYHGGFESDLDTGKKLSDTTENIGYKICSCLDFDILLTGHQHMSVDGRMVNGTYVVQPAANGREYHSLNIEYEDGNLSVKSERISPDPAGAAKLGSRYSSIEEKVQKWLDEPMGFLSRPLYPEDKLEMALKGSPIADFINRIQLEISGAQLSAVGLANEIAGFNREVTTRDIIATYPYPNTLVVCRINGKQLRAAIERSAEYFAVKDGKICIADSFLIPKIEHYNYDYFAGVEYRICPEAEAGSRVKMLERNGAAVKDEDEFTLCMNNYRYSGAGGYPMYPECPVVKEINTEMVEIIMDYFREHREIVV